MDTSLMRLCFIQDNWAYFTSLPVKDQRGEDWENAPYELNAGRPYSPHYHEDSQLQKWEDGTLRNPCRCEKCCRDWNEDGTPKWMIMCLQWNGLLDRPADGDYSEFVPGGWSVNSINAGEVPWLATNPWEPCDPENRQPMVRIYAGATIKEFSDAVESVGGWVSAPLLDWVNPDRWEILSYPFETRR